MTDLDLKFRYHLLCQSVQFTRKSAGTLLRLVTVRSGNVFK